MGDTQNLQMEEGPGKGYALSGKIMLSAIVILFAVVVFMVGLHLYARWYLIRLRRRQLERRRQRRVSRTQIVLYAERGLPGATVDRGLEAAVLHSLPVVLYSGKAEQPPPECAVCLSEFEEKEIVRLLPKCSHSFHIECIDMWFRSHSTCPLCRSPVERVVEASGSVAVAVAEPGPSSGCGACPHAEGSTTSLEGRRKGAVRIEVPPRRAESASELTPTQSSPASRLLSFRRILSMGRRSPVGGGGGPTTPCGAGRSELDLESGMGELNRESSRVQTTI